MTCSTCLRTALCLAGAGVVAFASTGCGSLKFWGKEDEGAEVSEDAGVAGEGDPAVEVVVGAAADPLEAEFLQACAAAAAGSPGATVVGRDGWLFDRAELVAVAQGSSPGTAAAASSVAAVVEYERQLGARGIDLIVVPVPPKAVIYPDEVSTGWKLSDRKVKRFDSYLQGVYASLRSAGVGVVDPTDGMLERREAKTGRMFPKTASHWSARACELVAAMIADEVREGGWVTDAEKRTGIVAEEGTLAVPGDLGGANEPAENIPARIVTGVGDVPSAKLLLLGSDAATVLSEAGAGIADQLAFELRVPALTIAAPDDARNVPRTRLLRRTVQSPGFLRNRRTLVWIIDATEFYEADWRQVPASLELQQGEETLR